MEECYLLEYFQFPRLNELKIGYPVPKLLTANATVLGCQNRNVVHLKQALIIQVIHYNIIPVLYM